MTKSKLKLLISECAKHLISEMDNDNSSTGNKKPIDVLNAINALGNDKADIGDLSKAFEGLNKESLNSDIGTKKHLQRIIAKSLLRKYRNYEVFNRNSPKELLWLRSNYPEFTMEIEDAINGYLQLKTPIDQQLRELATPQADPTTTTDTTAPTLAQTPAEKAQAERDAKDAQLADLKKRELDLKVKDKQTKFYKDATYQNTKDMLKARQDISKLKQEI